MSSNKNLMSAMEQPGWSAGKQSRPVTAGGGTLKIGAKTQFYKAKQRATSIQAIKAAEEARRKSRKK